MTTTELIEILSNAEQSVSEIDFEKYLYKIANDNLRHEMYSEMERELFGSNCQLESLGLKVIPAVKMDINNPTCQIGLEVINNKPPFATVSFNKDELQKIIDKKAQEYEIDAEKIRAKAIDEFVEKLKKRYPIAENDLFTINDVLHTEIDKIAEQMKEGGKND